MAPEIHAEIGGNKSFLKSSWVSVLDWTDLVSNQRESPWFQLNTSLLSKSLTSSASSQPYIKQSTNSQSENDMKKCILSIYHSNDHHIIPKGSRSKPPINPFKRWSSLPRGTNSFWRAKPNCQASQHRPPLSFPAVAQAELHTASPVGLSHHLSRWLINLLPFWPS